MPEEYVCQDCGNYQEVVSDGESCPNCGGRFVNINEELVTDDLEDENSPEEDFNVGEGYSGAI